MATVNAHSAVNANPNDNRERSSAPLSRKPARTPTDRCSHMQTRPACNAPDDPVPVAEPDIHGSVAVWLTAAPLACFHGGERPPATRDASGRSFMPGASAFGQWLVASAQAAAESVKEGGFMGFGA